MVFLKTKQRGPEYGVGFQLTNYLGVPAKDFVSKASLPHEYALEWRLDGNILR